MNKLLWYCFDQNNSGGRYHRDKDVSNYVFVQAGSSEEANTLVERIGIYFDGVENGSDCACCGDRWHPEYEGYSVPTRYGEEFKVPTGNELTSEESEYRFYPYGSIDGNVVSVDIE